MNIQDKQINGVTVLTIAGSIDALTAPQITAYINDLIAKNQTQLIADFSGVDYTSSAGLRMLLGAVKETRAKGGDFYLVAVQPDVEKVLTLSGFTSILKVFADLDTAVNSFAS